ncbi:unnamed protein product, partial [Prorocentrum cordatum]
MASQGLSLRTGPSRGHGGICLPAWAPASWAPSATVRQLSERARANAVKLAERDVAERKVRFQQWVARQTERSGGRPHAAAKLPIGFAVSPVQVNDDVESQKESYAPVDLGAKVTALEVEWRRWRRTTCEQVNVQWPSDLGVRPPGPTAQQLRKVLVTFPARRRLVFDGIARDWGTKNDRSCSRASAGRSCERAVVAARTAALGNRGIEPGPVKLKKVVGKSSWNIDVFGCLQDDECTCEDPSHVREMVNVTVDGLACYACEPKRPPVCTEAADQCTPEACECADPGQYTKQDATTVDGTP